MVLIVNQNWGKNIDIVFVWAVVWSELIDTFSVTTKTYTFGRALVWTGPKFIFPYLQKHQNLTSSMAYMQKLSGPAAHFSKVPIINGPVKLLLFT